jgi:hypothetical protein
MVEGRGRWIAARDLESGPPIFVWIHLVGRTSP